MLVDDNADTSTLLDVLTLATEDTTVGFDKPFLLLKTIREINLEQNVDWKPSVQMINHLLRHLAMYRGKSLMVRLARMQDIMHWATEIDVQCTSSTFKILDRFREHWEKHPIRGYGARHPPS